VTSDKYKAVFFDLDDTLFNSTLMSTSARRNAIRAIKEAGLDLDEEEAYKELVKIVKKYGSNYGFHFNRLIEKYSENPHPKLVAAAIVAYHSEKFALLRPFPDVITTLLTIMKNIPIGLISDGKKVKQWEKLIYLGLQHFFDVVVINESEENQKPASIGFEKALYLIGLKASKKIIYVGNKIETDILGANKMGITSILYDPQKKIKIKSLSKKTRPDICIHRISQLTNIVGFEQKKLKF
jgi:putative hydrolase of the HAD superfamily